MWFFHKRIITGPFVGKHGYDSRDLKAKGGYTFAAEERNGELFWGMSICHKKDNYCKARGREIAEGRVKTHVSFSTLLMGEEAADKFAETVATLLLHSRRTQVDGEILEVATDVVSDVNNLTGGRSEKKKESV